MPRTCPVCQEVIPAGCNGSVTDSDCWAWTGDGSEASPFVLAPVLSADPSQRLVCSDGLFADVPAVLADPPTAQAYNASNLAIAHNTATTLTLNSEAYDTDTMHSTSANTGRITFTTAGVYIVTLDVVWKNHATGDRSVAIRKNGTDTLASDTKDAGGADLSVGHAISILEEFSAADYVEARVTQTSGVSLAVLSESFSPIFGAVRVA